MRYHYYYVVYAFGTGFGSCQIPYEKKIESIDDVDVIRRYISEQWCEGHSVLIINWKPIKKPRKIMGNVDDDK